MSNNNANQNNERTYNNNHRGRNNNRNKVAKQPKVNPNEIKAPLYLSANLSEDIINEITDVLTNTRFNKISIPLSTYRCLVDSNVDADDNRVCTIGYIRNYNAETKEFTVVVFSNFIDIIKEQGDIALELQFTKYKEGLGTITKFIIVPVYNEESEDDIEE